MKIALVFFLLGFFANIYGQVNIEKYNRLKGDKGVSGNVALYLSSRTGNTDVQEIELDGRVNYKTSSFYTFIIGQGEYGWNKGKEFSNNALLHARYIRDFKGIVDPEIFGQINYNKSRLLNFRSLIGGGIRFPIISDSLSSLSLGTSYMYETEKLDLLESAKHPQKTNVSRWSSYINFSSNLSSNTRLSIIIYAQPDFEEFKDVRILSENLLSVKISRTFSLSLGFSLRYDSRPPDSVKDTDTNTKLGFALEI